MWVFVFDESKYILCTSKVTRSIASQAVPNY